MKSRMAISVDAEVDLHGCPVFFPVGVLVDDGLAYGVGLSSCEAAGVLPDVASVLFRIELGKDAGIAVIATYIARRVEPMSVAGG